MFMMFWLCVIPIAIVDQAVMTVIVHREYLNHRSLWEGDGQPHGMFWIPRESRLWGWFVSYAGAHAFYRLTWKWLVSTPAWITKDRDTHRLLLLHRILFLALGICVVGPFAIALVSQAG